MASMPEPSPRWTRFQLGGVATTQTCWVLEMDHEHGGQDILLWEFRRVLDAVWGKPIVVHKYSRSAKSEDAAMLTAAGLDIDGNILPSLKAWAAANPGVMPQPFLQSEYQITTEALLALLGFGAHARRFDHCRQNSLALLSELFGRALSDERARQLLLQQPQQPMLEMCAEYSPVATFCPHVRGLVDLLVCERTSPAALLAKFAVHLNE